VNTNNTLQKDKMVNNRLKRNVSYLLAVGKMDTEGLTQLQGDNDTAAQGANQDKSTQIANREESEGFLGRETPDLEINVKDGDGNTKLHNAFRTDNIGQIATLLATPGINVNTKNNKGMTPLHFACWKKNNEAVATLLTKPNIQINVKNNMGATPLHCACWKNDSQAAAMLLSMPDIEVNPLIDMKEFDGWTPIMVAAAWCHVQALRIMLEDERVDLKAGGEGLEACVGKGLETTAAGREQCLQVIREGRKRKEAALLEKLRKYIDD